jgi:hypothetical protein
MAGTIGGIGGNITLAGFSSKVSAWEANIVCPNADITGFDSKDWTEAYPHGIVALDAKIYGTGLSAAGTTIQGSGGFATFPSGTMKFDSFVVNCGTTLANTTGFSDGGYQVVEGMLGIVTGSASGTITEEGKPIDAAALTNPITPGSFASTLELQFNAGVTFSGLALITNVRMQRSITGKMVGTVDFQYTSRVTPTWPTTPPFPLAMWAETFAPAQAKVAGVVLTALTGHTFTFPGVVYNTSITRAENAKCDVTYSIASAGAIAIVW